MKDYTVKAGKHSSGFKPRFWKDDLGWNVKACFTESCIYKANTKENQKDWWKVWGLSFGIFPDKNSARWASRWNPDTQLFEVAPYCHLNYKKAMFEPAFMVKVDEEFTTAIYKNDKTWNFWYGKDGYNADSESERVLHGGVPDYGWKLKWYVGGDYTIDHDATIKMDW